MCSQSFQHTTCFGKAALISLRLYLCTYICITYSSCQSSEKIILPSQELIRENNFHFIMIVPFEIIAHCLKVYKSIKFWLDYIVVWLFLLINFLFDRYVCTVIIYLCSTTNCSYIKSYAFSSELLQFRGAICYTLCKMKLFLLMQILWLV